MGLKKSKHQVYLQDNNDVQYRDCFEDLSNEVIYELFDYLSFHDISLAFGNINSRLQNLIDSYPHYVNLEQQKQTDDLLLPRYIHSLRINARYQLAFIDYSKITSLQNLIVANITPFHILHLINNISLEDLEYLYLGVCFYNDRYDQQLKEIQQKILSLGGLSLKKCVFRMELCADIDQLPIELSSLEYLRIDGCKNIWMVNKLLDRMPNLRSLYVSILELEKNNDHHHIQQNNKHKCLTKLTIRIPDHISLEQLIPLLDQNGSAVENLTIKLNAVREDNVHAEIRHPRMTKLRQRVTVIINQSLPQLKNFRLRQIVSQNYHLLTQKSYVSPYVEVIPSSLEHQSYRVSIAGQFQVLWQNIFQ